jgi:hypothetical protein
MQPPRDVRSHLTDVRMSDVRMSDVRMSDVRMSDVTRLMSTFLEPPSTLSVRRTSSPASSPAASAVEGQAA